MDDLELRIRMTGEAGSLQAAAASSKSALEGVTTAAQAEADAFKRLTADAAQLAAANTALLASVKSLGDANLALTARMAALEAQLGKSSKGMGGLGVSAGQTAAAMRMLPAQITDVVTSLASGQQAWLVAIQQGGQIKDSFGGIGPALTALRAAISPTMLALGGLAAAAGAVALAYNQGSFEADAYRRAIVLTGNAAGTTVQQLQDQARTMSAVVGTQSAAAEVLAQLAGTGRIAADQFDVLGAGALKASRDLGISVEDTVRQYEALARDPVRAVVKLNEQYHFLSLAVYEQIKALDKQGQQQAAARLAMETYGKALGERADEVNRNLGTMERGWRAVTGAAKAAWDAMLNIGREQTMAEQLASVEAQIKALDDRKSNNPAQTAARRAVLVDKAAALRESMQIAERAATNQGVTTRGIAAAIAAAEEADRKNKGGKSDADRAREAAEQQRLDMIRSNLQSLTSAYSDAERVLEAQRQAGQLSEAQYWEAKRAFIALGRDAQLSALQAENDALEAEKATASERIANQSKIAQNKAQMASVQAKAAADLVVANASEAASLERLNRATADYARQLDEARQARARQQGRDIAGLGRGDAARGLAGRQNALEDRYYDELRRLDSDKQSGGLKDEQYQQRLTALKAYHQKALADEITFQADIEKAQGDGSLGMQRALENYLDSAKNVAGQTEQLFDRAFQGMEDALVKFVQTGKIDFKSLADSIIADLIRIAVRQQLTSAISSSGSSWFSTAASFVSSFFGGGLAAGGSAERGRMYEVNEAGPETLHVNGRTYLMMGRESGAVQPNRGGSAGGGLPGGAVQLPAIYVINQTGTAATATTKQRSDGGLEVLLQAAKSAVADDIANGSGQVTAALQGRYGLRSTFGGS